MSDPNVEGIETPEPQPFHHISVMPEEAIAGLAVQPGGTYLDATLGGGGHSALILGAAENVNLVGLDQDAQALAAAGEVLSEWGSSARLIQTNFAEFKPQGQLFDGILADLGVSSAQLDRADRGFSFRQAAPLDMRMDQSQDLTAADIINDWDEAEIANVFYTYGEERLSRRIARAIVDRRPVETTLELAEIISRSVPKSYRYGRIHPATRSFQGLRIAVNREMEVLEKFLAVAPTWLKPGGRIVVITFHSLEDRMVKHRFRENELLKVLTKKPMIPTEQEQETNVRSRSAKLRIAERWADEE
ncbi:MAG: 16S rRNA (cytosine(1402)-N(4))-methyltransferase RsmH [Alkalinema sp. RU_4_3]|nr:16S rRNA (cytosine(1402)-N(4))-methyltransferase RsmH [Alkalinema sp. RU_4_3]